MTGKGQLEQNWLKKQDLFKLIGLSNFKVYRKVNICYNVHADSKHFLESVLKIKNVKYIMN